MRFFVDREYEIARARRAIDADLNVLVLGPRRSGRTSFLRKLSSDVRAAGIHAVVVEGALADDARTFLALLRYRLLGDEYITADEAAARDQNERHFHELGASVRLATPESETEHLLDAFRALRYAAANRPGRVVLVDEMTSATLTHTVFGRYRDETWDLPLRWVVAGDVEARATYTAAPADAFFETTIELAPLDDASAAELLRRRIGEDSAAVDEQTIDALVKIARGNPHRLIAAARRVLIDGVAIEQLSSRLEHQRATLAGLGPAATRLYDELLANGPSSASNPELLERLAWSRGRAAQVFAQLEKSGLVRGSRQRSLSGGPDRKAYEPVAMP